MTNDLAIRILNGDILCTTEQTHEAVAMAVKALSALPSADTVEVVRCYECVWWDTCPSSRIAPNFHKCKRVWRMSMPSDGFCSYGEREKENKK